MMKLQSKILAAFSFMQYLLLQTAYADEVQVKQAELANQAEHSEISYKLTASYYKASDNNDATDINLRVNYTTHTLWVGNYQDKNGFHQLRTGYEFSPDFDFVRPTFSLQLAEGGFIGGSVTSEVGGNVYAIVGIGRTNLRNYYNLNFDPNDAITVGAGTRAFDKMELSLFQVFDDRLDTRQRITHFLCRYKPSDTQRISLDVSYKSGLDSHNEFINGYGVSIDYGYQQYFARVAREQYANFAASDLTRFSIGMRF
jgi:hypothetical protein